MILLTAFQYSCVVPPGKVRRHLSYPEQSAGPHPRAIVQGYMTWSQRNLLAT